MFLDLRTNADFRLQLVFTSCNTISHKSKVSVLYEIYQCVIHNELAPVVVFNQLSFFFIKSYNYYPVLMKKNNRIKFKKIPTPRY